MSPLMLDVVRIVVGLAGLYFGGNWLVSSAARLARRFGVPPVIVGLTVVSVGTSMPEMLVSIQATLRGSGDIVMGNVIGSNIANIGLILGLTGLVTALTVGDTLVRREIPIMIMASGIVYVLVLQNALGRITGTLLLGAYILFVGLAVWQALRGNGASSLAKDVTPAMTPSAPPTTTALQDVLVFVVGLAVLLLGATFTVDGATAIARSLGVSELAIGITLVAVGTSLPELAASLIAAGRNEDDIAVGNVVGSNIANLLFILGLAAMFNPFDISLATRTDLITLQLPFMLGFSFVLLPFVLRRRLPRWAAFVFLVAYIGFVPLAFV